MKKLTETLVQQRLKTCTTDLDKVLQINITGRELQDVSLLKTMTGVEILSLSVNKISSLADFQNCKNLKELYLRHNNISNLNELFYLTNLPRLELLMLSENPCANDPLYRMTVIKNLKHLVELDGVPISPDERMEALKLGKNVYGGELIADSENSIPDGPQILRTPTQSIQKLTNFKTPSKKKKTENSINCVTGQRSEMTNQKIPTEEVSTEWDSRISSSLESPKGKRTMPISEEEIQENVLTHAESKEQALRCKFCRNTTTKSSCETECITIAPKNPNILSAVLNLVKELDYPSLQILNAEVVSRLNTYQIDIFCNSKIGV